MVSSFKAHAYSIQMRGAIGKIALKPNRKRSAISLTARQTSCHWVVPLLKMQNPTESGAGGCFCPKEMRSLSGYDLFFA